MADPLSITISVVALIKAAGQAGLLLHQFCVDLGGINVTLTGLLNDVASFKHVLETMQETFDQEEMKTNLTGHVGNHWKNVAKALHDSEETLEQLNILLESVNKKVKLLDGPRKVMRFKSSIEQIGLFREQIQSYRGMLETSLTTIIVVNQITFQKSNESTMEQSSASLHALFVEIRDQVTSLNHKIDASKKIPNVVDGDDSAQRVRMINLRECYRSAADVVSTTSSTLTVQAVPKDEQSIVYGSELGDILPKEPSESMRRWLSFKSVARDNLVSADDHGGPGAEELSDSDSDIDGEMVQVLFDEAKRLKDQDNLEGAAMKLQSCLSLSSEMTGRSKLVGRPEILDALVEIYWTWNSWSEARSMLVQKMALTEREHGTKNSGYAWDTLNLGTLLMREEKYVEAQLQGRRALRSFRKLKEPGQLGFEKSLMLLIDLAKILGRKDEEDAYVALLANHQAVSNAAKDSNRTPDVADTVIDNQAPKTPTVRTPDYQHVDNVQPQTAAIIGQDPQGVVRSERIVPNFTSSQPELSQKLRGSVHVPVSLAEIWCVMIQTEAIRLTHSTELDLVSSYSRDLYGRNPQWATHFDGVSWSCLLFFNDTEEILVSHMRQETIAKEAALSAACYRLLPHRMAQIQENGGKLSDPTSDKQVLVRPDAIGLVNGLQPAMVIGVDFGIIDTAVAYAYGVESPQSIQNWPGRPGFNENRIPSCLAYNESTGEMTWGFLAHEKLKEHGWVAAMPGFKALLSDADRGEYNQQKGTSQPMTSKQDVIMLHVQYFSWLYDCIQTKIEAHLASNWEHTSILFTFSYPVSMMHNSTQIQDLKQALSLAGFGQASNHRLVLEHSEPRAVITAAIHDYRFYAWEAANFITCEIGSSHTNLSAWRTVKDITSSHPVLPSTDLRMERQATIATHSAYCSAGQALIYGIDNLLAGRENMFLDRTQTWILLYGDPAILPYIEIELKDHYKSEKADHYRQEGIFVMEVSEPQLCVAKGLVFEQLDKLYTVSRPAFHHVYAQNWNY